MIPETAFLERILATPEEDSPRLIFADWLDERGDPRGEFIRVQCALARLPADDPRRFDLMRRERQLRERHGEHWAAPLRGLATAPLFRRGLVEIVNVEARIFLARGGELFGRAPIQHVRLLDVGSSLSRLASCAHLGRLTGLTFFAQHLGDRLARALAECEHLSGLRTLELGRNRLGDSGVEALAHSPVLSNLLRLDLSDNFVSDLGAQALAASSRLKQLRRLELNHNELTADGLEALAASALLSGLTDLELSMNRLHVRHTLGRYRLSGEPRLRALDIRTNMLPGAAVAPLLGSPNLVGLRCLDLGHNPLGDDGIQALTRCEGLCALKALWLNDTGLADAGLTLLVGSPTFSELISLDVSHNPQITDIGARTILGPNPLRVLRRVAPPTPTISSRMRRSLQARFGLPYRSSEY